MFFKLLSFACSSPVVSPAGCLICVLFGDDGGLSFFEKTSESKAVVQKKKAKSEDKPLKMREIVEPHVFVCLFVSFLNG